MNDLLLAIVVNHLWQSTLFAACIGGLTLLLRRNAARLRHLLWLAASLKFMLPFALVAVLGTLISWQPQEAVPSASRALALAGDLASPLAVELRFPELRPDATVSRTLPWWVAALVVWSMGAGFVAIRWLVRWRAIRRALRGSVAVAGIDFPAPVRSTSQQFEPGIVGVFHPVLLLPQGIAERLTAEQMQAVLAHERCHLRWRDNFTATLHMLVETLFWFYPPVWWIGKRFIAERERACDEQVAREGHAPERYAEGILAVCEHYVISRLPCVSGVSGADLRKRIENILRNTRALQLDGARKLLLATVACGAVAAPIAAGMLAASPFQVVFSLGPFTMAMMDYWQVSIVSNQRSGAVLSISPSASCPAPGAEVLRRQEVLAARVAQLVPADGDQVLLFAVAANSVPEVQRLLAAGASRRGDGHTLPDSLMHVAARYSDVPMLEFLSKAGFAVDGLASAGIAAGSETPLMAAISAHRLDNARWFIQQGVDVNVANQYGNTALIMAMAVCRDRQLVAELIGAGARPNARAVRIAGNLGFDVQPPLLRRIVPRTRGTLSVNVDLDGDAKNDEVVALPGRGVFARLSSRDPDRPIKVADPPQGGPWFKLEIAAPGTYGTACAKGHGKECQPPEPASLTLERPGIWIYQEEGARSVVYWDSAAGRFERVWIVD
jgi:beta-lactamase regulating signal transducer with metallopeptidase domain